MSPRKKGELVAVEIEGDDAAWLRGRDLDGAEVVVLDEVVWFDRVYEETESGLYVPTERSATDRALDRALKNVVDDPRPTGLSLFSGAGGFDLGMEQGGFDVVCGCEWDLFAAMTYLNNLGRPDCKIAFDTPVTEAKWRKTIEGERARGKKKGGRPMPKDWIGSAWRKSHEKQIGGARGFYVGDIRKTTGAALLELAGVDHVDVIFGGPPCQGLSSANSRACLEDPRNGLLWEFMRIVTELKPKSFIIENVPQILTAGKGGLFNALCKIANEAGFDVVAQRLNAVWYGVPQNRVRAIIVGSLGGSDFQFPMPSHWGHGRKANGERWQIGVDEDEIADEAPMADFDKATGTWSSPDEPETPKATEPQKDLFGEEAA